MRHARALAVAVPASLVLIAGLVILTTSGATAAKGPTYTAKAEKTGLANAAGGIHPGSAWFAQGNLLNSTHHDVGTGYVRCELSARHRSSSPTRGSSPRRERSGSISTPDRLASR
jgi:hypothetical protein